MKRFFLVTAAVFMGWLCLPGPSLADDDNKSQMGNVYIQVNPLGFVQVGPSVELGFQIMPGTYIGPHIRFLGLGLLTHVLAEDELSVASVAPGIQMIYNMPYGEGQHRLYMGGFFELGFTWETGDRNTQYEWNSSTGLLIFGASFGHKWRFSPAFLNVGLFGGAGVEIWDNWWYVSNPNVVYSESKDLYIVAGLELSLGIEF